VHAQQTQLSQLRDDLFRKVAALEPLVDVGKDPLADELPDRVSNQAFLVRVERFDVEDVHRVHGLTLPSGPNRPGKLGGEPVRRGPSISEHEEHRPPKPRFGEEDRELSYGTYLRLPDLLAQQNLLSDPPAHDELLFIVIHQAFELWFKAILFELESIRESLFAGDSRRARHYLRRVHTIERVLIQQIPVLETMSPQDFLEFRHNLAPASGFQSLQFHEIEAISGLKEPGLVRRLGDSPEERSRLERRMSEPTLWDAFCSLMNEHGFPMPEDDPEARRESLLKLAWSERGYTELWAVAESLLSHDENIAAWRQRHVLMVERQIGGKTGTGGSTGVGYLRTTLDKRFYPELWDLRSYL
jgi:tryptophan 2,3-dioxygenase